MDFYIPVTEQHSWFTYLTEGTNTAAQTDVLGELFWSLLAATLRSRKAYEETFHIHTGQTVKFLIAHCTCTRKIDENGLH
ncbi:hypothetical protein E2C01_004817 [Portunus trituberculatus]|uniref:Uncharacterized protein n=1 Tax=Portunus trituberculatus TaxID=210409 RepID=A0A5B7CRJ6_PORTR|nr:hypothetical protein [Portunus trituberculatus]